MAIQEHLSVKQSLRLPVRVNLQVLQVTQYSVASGIPDYKIRVDNKKYPATDKAAGYFYYHANFHCMYYKRNGIRKLCVLK